MHERMVRMATKVIYPYLDYAITERALTYSAVAERAGIATNAFSRKMHGKSPVRVEEAIAIRDVLEVKWDIAKLFRRSEGLRKVGADGGSVA